MRLGCRHSVQSDLRSSAIRWKLVKRLRRIEASVRVDNRNVSITVFRQFGRLLTAATAVSRRSVMTPQASVAEIKNDIGATIVGRQASSLTHKTTCRRQKLRNALSCSYRLV
jgi:hypothetical protein